MNPSSYKQELFATQNGHTKTLNPLADQMRPDHLKNFLGQEHLVGEGKILREEIQNDQVRSYIFWGPPGCGKTTLAHLIAQQTQKRFVSFSAVLGGVKELREIVETAKAHLQKGKQTLLFVDEVHRFNKSQQDAFLPHVENGTLILLGATTENPSFEINRALLSRCKVLLLKPLSEENLKTLIHQTWEKIFPDHEYPEKKLDKKTIDSLAQYAQGDARRLLNTLESIKDYLLEHPDAVIDTKILANILDTKEIAYDRKGEEHYNIISAFIKSMRGSDPDASLYYLARMLEAGEDPRFIARRMIIFASEDIGNADPRALTLAVSAAEAFDRVGLAEGWIPLAQAVAYLASVPKSNASYQAYRKAKKEISVGHLPPVPLHLRNAPTRLMKDIGYGKAYRYPHNDDGHINDQTYLPEGLEGKIFYEPSQNGFEQKIKEFLDYLRKIRKSSTQSD